MLDDAYATKPFTGADLADANKLRAEVNKAAAADAVAEGRQRERRARAPRTATRWSRRACSRPSTATRSQGAQLIEQGIAKGGITQPEEAALHLGYAQVRPAATPTRSRPSRRSRAARTASCRSRTCGSLYLQSRLQAAAPAPAAAASK